METNNIPAGTAVTLRTSSEDGTGTLVAVNSIPLVGTFERQQQRLPKVAWLGGFTQFYVTAWGPP